MKAIALIALACSSMNAAYGSEHGRLTFDQAAALAMVAATIKGDVRPNSISQEASGRSDQKINSRRFNTIEIIYPDSAGTSPYTVDFYTGDVFASSDRGWGDCGIAPPNAHLRKINTQELKMIQRKVRHNLHLTWAEYQKLRTQKPRCRDQ